jgi:hypothetical protein
LDEKFAAQYVIDFRTGSQSAIHGSASCAEQRAACLALNRGRARGILEADQLSFQGQPLSTDVWEAAFARITRQWQVPVVSLEHFGIKHDRDGFRIASSDLVALPSGAEACPYYDKSSGAVYKLFDLQASGSLGKKLVFEWNEEGGCEVVPRPATLRDTLDKLLLLNEIGAHPTEVVGLTDDGHYLLIKQPLARASADFQFDRADACQRIKGIVPTATGFRTTLCVVWHHLQAWIVGDLHERNIMRDGEGNPTIIDALVAPIPPFVLRQNRSLREASEDAEAWRRGQPLPQRKRIDDVDDDEL